MTVKDTVLTDTLMGARENCFLSTIDFNSLETISASSIGLMSMLERINQPLMIFPHRIPTSLFF